MGDFSLDKLEKSSEAVGAQQQHIRRRTDPPDRRGPVKRRSDEPADPEHETDEQQHQVDRLA